MLPGPGSLTEPILLPVPLASPGPRHPAGPSALQPQRSTAARHSTPGPAPLLMHMQPYSGAILSFTNPSTTDRRTHTSYNQRNDEKWVSTSTIQRQHNRPGPKHSLITLRSHMPAQRPPTVPHKTQRWHPEDLLPSFCYLRTSSPAVSICYLGWGFLQQHQQSLQHQVGETRADGDVV